MGPTFILEYTFFFSLSYEKAGSYQNEEEKKNNGVWIKMVDVTAAAFV